MLVTHEQGLERFVFHQVDALSLYSILKEQGKLELVLLAKQLNIKNMSQKSKGELQSIIQSDIYIYLEKYLLLMNDYHLRFLYDFLQYHQKDEEHFFEPNVLQFFTSYGILYPVIYNGRKMFVIPREIHQYLYRFFETDYTEIFNRNQRVVEFATWCLDTYGLIEYQKFLFLYQMKYQADQIYADFKEILHLEAALNQNFICDAEYFYKNEIKYNLDHFLHKRKTYPFDYNLYHLEHVEAINERIALFQRMFWKWTKKLDLNLKQAIFQDLILMLNLGYDIEAIRKALKGSGQFKDKEISKLINKIHKFYPQLFLWVLKGHSTE